MSLDGSKFKANFSKHKAMSHERLKEKEKELMAQIQAAKEALEKREAAINPGKEIDGKKQISFADKEARIMGKRYAKVPQMYWPGRAVCFS